jgi:hypothetical protein
MTSTPSLPMFQRKSLDQITEIPESIISVYVVENHIWADGGSEEARAVRQAETRTVDELLLDPVRPFLNDIFRQMAAPYAPERRDNPIGQGYWIQAEFGSGKSHLLSFIGALALGGETEWNLIRDKERKAGLGRRESLYNFYENGLAKKTQESKGIFVAVKTLVGQGGGAIGVSDTNRALTEYVLDAVADQFHLETGRSLPLYPTQILAERFLNTGDLERYRHDLSKFLQDPQFFDQEEQEDIADFLDDLQNNPDPGVQRDCGQRLWDFYEHYLKTRPRIPMETEEVLKHMVQRLLDEGYAGLLLILDEVSLFMRSRADVQRFDDEKALVVLSNRLAKVENLPVWTVCAAQQALESRAGVKNILARERLDLVPLLNQPDAYYDIALSRVREVTDPAAVDQYYEDYKRGFSWPQAVGRDQFARFFPFYPPSMDVVRAVSYNLTTVRSALYFMLQTLKTQRKRESRELITLWALFDDVVEYEEDPSGTTKGIANIKAKWPADWQAYDTAKHQLDMAVKGPLKIYRGRCEKIIKTLFLYHVANLAPDGLGHEELMNGVMEWKDHDKEQAADLQDNLDHYEILSDKVERELAQVVKVGPNYRFNPTGGGPDPRELFQKARAEAEHNQLQRRQAWEALLALDGWRVTTRLMTLDLAPGVRSILRDVAPSTQKDITLKWRGREISGRVYMRDLLDIARRGALLPSINSAETGLDYAVFISSTPAVDQLDALVGSKKDPRVLFWAPDALTPSEGALLVDFAAYRELVREYSGRDNQQAKEVIDWLQGQLREQAGTIYRIVPDSYGRGRVAALDHSQLSFIPQGELPAIITPLAAQVLDATYESRELQFDAPAPFNDTNAINVINGIVKVGQIPRGARPNRDISAAQNYGFDLQIMRRPNDRKLDLSQCRYTRDMADWIEEKLGDSGAAMPVLTLYKNFMGVGGPHGLNYGLSRRMVQLYLLCLVREGKVRVTLSGRKAPVEAIDYTNIASVDFKTAVLEALDQVQRLKPPEGWDVLAPFAAVLLQDPALRLARQDADIQNGVMRLLAFRDERLEPFRSLLAGLANLFQEMGQANPLEERLTAWETFLSRPVEPGNPIPFLRAALDRAFGYHVYQDDPATGAGRGMVRQEEVDDLAARRAEVQQAQDFFQHRERVIAAARYAAFELPADPALAEICAALRQARASLERLDELLTSEARLRSELLEPVEGAIQSYAVRYLQAFDQVTARAEQARQGIEALPGQPAYRALERLAGVRQLGSDPRPGLRQVFRDVLDEPAQLSPTTLTRAEVERRLQRWPQPPQCDLTLDNADQWRQKADEALARCQDALQAALRDKAALLHSDALRERLAQGMDAPFIAGLLAALTVEDVADYLVETLGERNRVFSEKPGFSDPVNLLTRYLKKLRVRRLRLSEFSPGKRTIEPGDVDEIVTEFRAFLLGALSAGDDELPVVELE